MTPLSISQIVSQLQYPQADSHKGQNGKVMIIGGSDLFHAASQWSFLAASRIVDMTFYASVRENNELLHQSKLFGRDGVVVRRADILSYLAEANAVLIGPGMRRDWQSRFDSVSLLSLQPSDLQEEDWEHDTAAVTTSLLRAFPDKKWIIDAGALQVIDPQWIPKSAILTPHAGELSQLLEKIPSLDAEEIEQVVSSTVQAVKRNLAENTSSESQGALVVSQPAQVFSMDQIEKVVGGESLHILTTLSEAVNNATILLKGEVDLIVTSESVTTVTGGNVALTKGGTGDVLAGVCAGFYATSAAYPSVVMASWLNKMAAHSLFLERGTMYNSSDLVDQVGREWAKVL